MAISVINPFKQPKRALELKLSNFKNFANCKVFVCLPDCNNLTTYLPPYGNLHIRTYISYVVHVATYVAGYIHNT